MQTLNKEHVRAFLPGYRDPWYDNGVWDYDCEGKMRLLKKGYFDMKTKEDFQGGNLRAEWVWTLGSSYISSARYMRPFWKGVTEAVRRRMPDAIIFMGGRSYCVFAESFVCARPGARHGEAKAARGVFRGRTVGDTRGVGATLVRLRVVLKRVVSGQVRWAYFPILYIPYVGCDEGVGRRNACRSIGCAFSVTWCLFGSWWWVQTSLNESIRSR